MKDILKHIENDFLLFDGPMGTRIQEENQELGEIPEELNITNPKLIEDIQYEYCMAGSQVLSIHTFGLSGLSMKNSQYSVDEIIKAAIKNARNAVKRSGKEVYLALDISPIGQLIEPIGTLSFHKAYDIYKEIVLSADKYGVDLVIIETMIDIYELKAAILAVKENSALPIFATMTFEENKRTLSGTDPKSMVTILEALGVHALGVNCSFGPKETYPIIKEICKYASLPIMVQPNAGIPKEVNGETVFPLNPSSFIDEMEDIFSLPIQIYGGCCGTNEKHIKALKEKLKTLKFQKPEKKNHSFIASSRKTMNFLNRPLIIGERINPTGKEELQNALIKKEYSLILKEAITQEEEGADVLDINVGYPEISEEEAMEAVVKEVQALVSVPLQIDSSHETVLEAGLRVYNGKAIINSVTGERESLEKVLPLAKKYGGMIIGLTMDEKGLALKADEKVEIAYKIIRKAKEFGIDKKDIIIDPLTVTASAQQKEVIETIKAIEILSKEGILTMAGVSNVSFGLPERELLNATFLNMTLYAGISACIVNTSNKKLMEGIYASRVLLNIDKGSKDYIEKIVDIPIEKENREISQYTIEETIVKGLKEEGIDAIEESLKKNDPLLIIEKEIMPGLDIVGKGYEEGLYFLPQLIQSAEVVKGMFEVIKSSMGETSKKDFKRNKIVLATVKGDIHDIGKNIVKMLLENYGFEVIDLGKNVEPKTILEIIEREDISLVGLSALMTTTVSSMAQTIDLIREKYQDKIKIFVGGAVLTKEYAKSINADYYAKDALDSVEYAKKHFK